MPNCIKLRVVKVGGSLLTSPTLVEDLRRWTALQAPAQTLFLAGGGALVDAIAEQQRTLGFDDVAAHWLCIRAMQIHFEMLAALMPECARVSTFGEQKERDFTSSGGLAWIEPWALMQHDVAHAEGILGLSPLPADWSVSSDSIAARAAMFVGAEELVLLKSTLSPAGPAEAGSGPFVDVYFHAAARRIPSVRFVNLRDPHFSEERFA